MSKDSPMGFDRKVIELDGVEYEIFEIERIGNPSRGITHCAYLRPVPKPPRELWQIYDKYEEPRCWYGYKTHEAAMIDVARLREEHPDNGPFHLIHLREVREENK